MSLQTSATLLASGPTLPTTPLGKQDLTFLVINILQPLYKQLIQINSRISNLGQRIGLQFI